MARDIVGTHTLILVHCLSTQLPLGECSRATICSFSDVINLM